VGPLSSVGKTRLRGSTILSPTRLPCTPEPTLRAAAVGRGGPNGHRTPDRTAREAAARVVLHLPGAYVPCVGSGADDGSSIGWSRVARSAGTFSGLALFIGTVLFLLDAADLLEPMPAFQRTSAGIEMDVANWYVAFFQRQHDILWSIAVRDSLLPLGFVALMALAFATARLFGWGRPEATLMALLFVVGGLLNIVNDLLYLGEIEYWRNTGWSSDPPGPMLAVGRASEALNNATVYLEAFSYVTLLGALCCLGLLCRSGTPLPVWLGNLAYVEAAGMAILVAGIGFHQDALFQIGGVATGIVLGPLVVIALGHYVGSAFRTRETAASTIA
jgi:hypothetical protein